MPAPDTRTVWLIAARFVRLLFEQGDEDLIPLLLEAARANGPDGQWLYEDAWKELTASWKERPQ